MALAGKDEESMPRNGKWYKLDNAAKIFPSAARGADTRVFRIAAELKEPVSGEILQNALDETIKEYPYYNSVLRKGLFWYYLDERPARAIVTEENDPVMAPLYIPGRRTLLYRVSFRRNRLNFEMFHVLSDGAGAFIFFKELVTNYLRLAHPEAGSTGPTVFSSGQEKTTDAFRKYYSGEKQGDQLKRMTHTRAFRLREVLDENLQNHVLEGMVSAKQFIALAHQYNTTAGMLSVALYIASCIDLMSERERAKIPVVISVPVDLRQYFNTQTTRNFFGVITVVYPPVKSGGKNVSPADAAAPSPDAKSAEDKAGSLDPLLADILPVVKEAFESQLTPEGIRATMDSYSALERNPFIRVVPLWVKDFVIGRYSTRTRKGVTATLSNLGRIRLAEPIAGYVDRISCFMSSYGMQVCVSSYGDKMVFGAASGFRTHNVMLHFFRRLTALGITAEITTNDYEMR